MRQYGDRLEASRCAVRQCINGRPSYVTINTIEELETNKYQQRNYRYHRYRCQPDEPDGHRVKPKNMTCHWNWCHRRALTMTAFCRSRSSIMNGIVVTGWMFLLMFSRYNLKFLKTAKEFTETLVNILCCYLQKASRKHIPTRSPVSSSRNFQVHSDQLRSLWTSWRIRCGIGRVKVCWKRSGNSWFILSSQNKSINSAKTNINWPVKITCPHVRQSVVLY